MKHCYVWILALLPALLGGCGKGTSLSTLKQTVYGFEHPQDSARTKVWWFHGETETTREGITADLEAFRTAGVGGVVYYDQVHSKGLGALDAFSPEWWDMLTFASQEARRLGLTFEAHVSNGYVAGGPWITPDLGMQVLTSTDTIVSGGAMLTLPLPVPQAPYSYYRDVAVLAFPYHPEPHEDSRTACPHLSSNHPEVDAEACFAPHKKLTRIPAQAPGRPVYLRLDFGRAFTARSIRYELRPRGKATTSATNVPAPPQETFVGTGYRILPDVGQLEASDDGLHYTPVCDLKPIYKAHASWKQKTISFPAVTARYFRLNLHDWYEADERNKDLQIGNIVLSAQAGVDQWEEKAALFSEYIEPDRTPAYAPAEVICPDSLIDLTDRVDSLGILRWQAPEGRWKILRFAHIPVGRKTKHGRANLTGLECDKLSATATRVQWENYFKRIADTLRTHGGRLDGMAIDSHEAGSQNWTPGFEREFLRLRGYDLRRYLPVMVGYVVQSREVSDGFLYDLRRTIADLISDKYYGTFQHLCDSLGISFTAQATGNALCIVADQIQAKGRVSKPQGEFWAIHPDGNYDIKESSSAAHLYGKTIASGEAFTDAKYSHSLAYLKQLADYAYGYGINEFVVCASAYQPWLDRTPGNTGGGRHYCLNRNNTFWPYSRGFWDYQARCAYVMRQGRAVVDLCVYLGENAPVKILTHRLPEIPAGYDFDACTTDALMHRMEARQGRIVLPDGMSYGMMILPRSGELTLEALRQIASFVKAGVPVYGPRPTGSGTLGDLSHTDEYQALANALWGTGNTPQGSHTYGKGTVYWGMPLHEALQKASLSPDISLPKNRRMFFAHRTLTDGEVYFIDNHEDTALEHTFTFRSQGKAVQWWNPVNGRRYTLPFTLTPEGRTSVSVKMAPRESGFIVLSAADNESLPVLSWSNQEKTVSLAGDWTVDFDPSLGGPGTVTFSRLTDWTQHSDPRIRHYSGTAVYHKTFSMESLTDARYLLRFQQLGAVARITLNGQEVGTVWCSPWEADITQALQPSDNHLEIHVANSLINRLIGDAALPESQRITYAATPIATPEDPLVPSGIIGDVQVVECVAKTNGIR